MPIKGHPGFVATLWLAGAASSFGQAGLTAGTPDSPVAVVQEATPLAPAAVPAVAGTIKGSVKAGVVPLPGVAVTAANTLTGKKYATTTDVNGNYAMTIPRTGRYVVRVELAAFATQTKEVRLTAEALAGTAEFGIELASRVAAREQAVGTQTATVANALAGAFSGGSGRGMQALSVTGADTGAADASVGGGAAGASLPSIAGLGGNGSDSVAVTGQVGQTNGLANLNEDDVRQRIQDALAQARQQGGAVGDQANAVASALGGFLGGGGFPGGFGGGGGRGGRGGGGGGFGGGRGFNPSETHGAVFYVGSNGVLNAAPFSVSGVPVANPANSQNSFGLSVTGSPHVPWLTNPDPKSFFFLNVTGGRNINPQIFNATVPTIAEREGDFSGLVQNVVSANAVTTPQLVPIYDPTTGAPFGCLPAPAACTPTNVIPQNRLSPQALALLNYYPAPNLSIPSTQGYNYQTLTTAGANSTQASLRYVRNFGQQPAFGGRGGGGGRRQANAPPALRQNINFNGSYSHNANDQRNVFLPLGGGNLTNGYGLTAGYTVGYGRFTNNASLNWNRSRTTARDFFSVGNPGLGAFGGNPAAGVLAGNGFYGVPNLTFSGFDGLSQQVPSNNVNQTISFSDFVSWNHKRHNMRFGGDIRRVHADSVGGTNIFGTYTFTGYATQNPMAAANTGTGAQQPASGSGFADFLLGLPQQTSIQAGLAKTYLRANVYDWYAQDDWRVKGGLTLNYGLRYEYFGPYSEKNGRLVNLDHSADFTQVHAVQAGGTGTFGGQYPAALVNGDHLLYSPRFGFAYRPSLLPKITKQMVVRGGYGINFNTGQYASFGRQLAFQPPFAVTQTNTVGQQGCTPGNLNLVQGFGCSTATTQNNYGVNKDYRLGHVQVWNLGVQRTFPLGIVANVDYNGSKGGALDIVRAPNRTATGLLDPTVQAFNFEDSQGFSRLNALAVNARKRLQKGISLQATYTFAHSIDNASTIGGTTVVVAQNDLDLNAEEGNSSFLRRQSVTGNWVFELPFGEGRAFLAKNGRVSKVFEGFNVSGNFNFASGPYFTPIYVATVTEVATGAAASRRPNRNFAVPIAGTGRLRNFFNTAAFTDPGTGYGTASRGSIEGPGTVSINSALSRTFSFGETRSFEARVSGTNVFNTVQYQNLNTTLNSPTFGQVTGAAARRSLQFTGRYRF